MNLTSQQQDLPNEDSLLDYCFTVNTFKYQKLKKQMQIEINTSLSKHVYQSIDWTTFYFSSVLKIIEHIEPRSQCTNKNGFIFNVYNYEDVLKFMCQHLIFTNKDMMFDMYLFDFIYLATTPDLLEWGIQHDLCYAAFGDSKIFGRKSNKIIGNLNDRGVKFNKKIPVIPNLAKNLKERSALAQSADFLEEYTFFDDNLGWGLFKFDQKIIDLYFDAVKIITPNGLICDPTKAELLSDALEKCDGVERPKAVSKDRFLENICHEDTMTLYLYFGF